MRTSSSHVGFLPFQFIVFLCLSRSFHLAPVADRDPWCSGFICPGRWFLLLQLLLLVDKTCGGLHCHLYPETSAVKREQVQESGGVGQPGFWSLLLFAIGLALGWFLTRTDP